MDGLRHGTGDWTSPNGEHYKGEWVEDKREGKGEWNDGMKETYQGDWVGNQRHGEGTWTSPDGDSYKGVLHSCLFMLALCLSYDFSC